MPEMGGVRVLHKLVINWLIRRNYVCSHDIRYSVNHFKIFSVAVKMSVAEENYDACAIDC